MNSKDFYAFIKDNDLKWVFDFLLDGFDILCDGDAFSNEHFIRIIESLKEGIEEEKETSLDIFSGIVEPVIAALSVFCEALDEYLEYSSTEDDKIVDGIYH